MFTKHLDLKESRDMRFTKTSEKDKHSVTY